MALFFLLFFGLLYFQEIENNPIPIQKPDKAPSHAILNELLQKHVDPEGTVDYRGMKQNAARLDAYLDLLAENPPRDDWSRVEKLAYWINAYNAFTVKLVTEHYPISSIMDLAGGKIWDTRTLDIGGVAYTLNDMEHTKLRKEIGDPRIHFAVNCAAVSCPPLYNEAFTQGNVDHLLNQRTKAFINNEKYNDISPSRVSVSKIFEWYAEDFGNLIPFLSKYTDRPIREDATIIFRDYNWELNG